MNLDYQHGYTLEKPRRRAADYEYASGGQDEPLFRPRKYSFDLTIFRSNRGFLHSELRTTSTDLRRGEVLMVASESAEHFTRPPGRPACREAAVSYTDQPPLEAAESREPLR